MAGTGAVAAAKVSSSPDQWLVPGQWLEIYKTNPSANRIKQNSEVLQSLDELKKREEAKLQPQHWIKSQKADLIFAAVIISYGLLTGIDVEVTVHWWPDEVPKLYESVMLAIQAVFVIVFVVELVLRVRAEGISYCLPFTLSLRREAPGMPLRLGCRKCNPAGFLDTSVIIFGTFELGVALLGVELKALGAAGPMRMLRLVRLVRIIKGLLVFEELRLLCAGMVSSLSAVFWAFVLLAMLMYLGSLFCVILLGKNEELGSYFGGVGPALFTHFMIVTLEAWPDIADDVIENSSPLWGIYFVIFICVSSLALMNLVTGVVCEKLLCIAQAGGSGDDEEQANQLSAFREDRERFRAKLTQVFAESDLDASATIDAQEFELMMRHPEMRQLFKLMEASFSSNAAELFQMLDSRAEGKLGFEQLAEALLRLRGSSGRVHSLMLQRDIIKRHQRAAQRITELEENLIEQTRAELSAVEDVVSKKLEHLQKSAVPCVEAPLHSEASAVSECGAWPQKLADSLEGANLKLEEQEVPLSKQLEGMEEATWRHLKAELPDGCSNLPQGALAQDEEIGGGLPASQERQPWMAEAGERLETLLGELDHLHAWAKELVVKDVDGTAKAQENGSC